jgi:hypothetical protein
MMPNEVVPTPAGKGAIFESASRAAAAYTSQEFVNHHAKGLRFTVANDAAGGSTATAKIQVKAPGSDVWVDLAGATSAAIGSSTGTITTVYPGLTGIADAANVSINQHLGLSWRMVLTIGAATGISSVSAVYLI